MSVTSKDLVSALPPKDGRSTVVYLSFVGLSLLLAAAFIVLIDVTQTDDIKALLIDRDRSTWPLTVQNVMWLLFAFGCAELVIRLVESLESFLHLGQVLIGEWICVSHDLPPVIEPAHECR